MRLIDDLLLDDFFHGGYQPGASLPWPQAPADPSASPEPLTQPATPPPGLIAAPKQAAPRRRLIVALTVGLLGVGLAIGARWLWLRRPTPTGRAASEVASPGPTQTAVIAEAEVPAVARSTSEPTTAQPEYSPSTPTPSALVQRTEAPTQPVMQAPPPLPQAASETVFSLIFTATSNELEARRWAALAEAQGLQTRIKTLKKTVKLYRVASKKGYDQSAARAIGLKATVFKIPVTAQVADDGMTHFDLGHFKASAMAEKALANAEKLGLEAAVVEEAQSTTSYLVETGVLHSEAQAQALAALLSQTSGSKVSIVKVR